jgi:Tol biopolymer transport system component
VIGRTVSHYRILHEIGSGGMGVVYKAEDTKLKRPVALKFLPFNLARDETAKKRLLREAQAISALQHHNICTIHAIDESEDGRLFICMDYYEGESLQNRLARGPLSAQEAIDIVTQAARGLEEAHRRGIVHRDIKPANIMVTNQGVVKILDFGLAKLGGQTKMTKTGSTLGTAAYMSPEQVRGEELDQRSDIFSLGIVFHELLTGVSPFDAEHEPAVMHKILNVAPPSLRASGVKRAADLEPVVGRMLAKEPELRFPSVSALIDDLKKLPDGTAAARKRLRRDVAGRTVAAALVLIGFGAAAFLAWKRPWQHRELLQRQLTSSTWIDPVGTGVISPDGRMLAVVDRVGVSLRAVESGESRQVALPDGFSVGLLVPTVSWFPDGSQLLVSGTMPDNTPCVWAIPVLGGRLRMVCGNGHGATISRDGSRIAYMSAGDAGPEIWCADITGENARRVLASDSTGTINTWAVWSPTGARLAYARASLGAKGFRMTLESCDLDGHRREILSRASGELHWYTSLLWAPDGRLFFGLADPPPSQSDRNLWFIRVDPSSGAASGEPRRITQWLRLSAVIPTGVSADGQRLSVRIVSYQSDCYVGDIAPGETLLRDVRRVTLDDRMDLWPAWTPDGKSILFSSDRNGSDDVFGQALDTTTATALVTGPGDQSAPAVSPDGRWVLYLERKEGEAGAEQKTRVMRMPVAGGPPERVFDTQATASFRCAASPAAVCVLSTSSGTETVFTSFDPQKGLGREVARVSAGTLPAWDLSPDGVRLAILITSVSPPMVRTVSLSDGSIHDTPLDRELEGVDVAWTQEGADCLVTGMSREDKMWNLYRVTANGKTTQLLPGQMWMYSAAASPDGRRVAFTSNTGESNVWMLENF